MVKNNIPLDNITKLVVMGTGGNLFLTGWNQDEIRIKDQSSEDKAEIKKNQIEIQCPGDGHVHIPHHLEVEIKSVGADLVIKRINSSLDISSVGGDLTLTDVNSVSTGSVGGDLLAKRVQGDLQSKNIGGDAIIDNVIGQISLKEVGRDIIISDIGGGIEAKAGGDGTIDFNPVPWQAYQITVGGGLSITMPEESNADLFIKSGLKDIRLTFGELNVTSQDKELSQQLGEGGPTVKLSAGGKVFLLGDDYSMFTGIKMNMKDFGEFSADFTAHTADQIKTSLDHLEVDLQESLSGLADSLEDLGLSEENLENIGIHIEETSRLAAEKAEKAAIKAQARVEKKIARARRKALKAQAKVKEFDLGDFLEDQKEKRAVNEAERMMILEMLQEKKISLDEADELLNALEGKKK